MKRAIAFMTTFLLAACLSAGGVHASMVPKKMVKTQKAGEVQLAPTIPADRNPLSLGEGTELHGIRGKVLAVKDVHMLGGYTHKCVALIELSGDNPQLISDSADDDSTQRTFLAYVRHKEAPEILPDNEVTLRKLGTNERTSAVIMCDLLWKAKERDKLVILDGKITHPATLPLQPGQVKWIWAKEYLLGEMDVTHLRYLVDPDEEIDKERGSCMFHVSKFCEAGVCDFPGRVISVDAWDGGKSSLSNDDTDFVFCMAWVNVVGWGDESNNIDHQSCCFEDTYSADDNLQIIVRGSVVPEISWSHVPRFVRACGALLDAAKEGWQVEFSTSAESRGRRVPSKMTIVSESLGETTFDWEQGQSAF